MESKIENKGKFERFRTIHYWVIVKMQDGCVDRSALAGYS